MTRKVRVMLAEILRQNYVATSSFTMRNLVLIHRAKSVGPRKMVVTCSLLLSWCLLYTVRTVLKIIEEPAFIDYKGLSHSFIESCLFSDVAVVRTRVARTIQVLREGLLPPASVSCETSSGEMRLLSIAGINQMCWYPNDYLRILRRVPRYLKKGNLILCDRDCVAADLSVFSVAKSREILDDGDRTVTLLPVNVGRHFKWVPLALRDAVKFDKKLPAALWRGATTGGCWDLDEANTSYPLCARRNLVVKWALSNSSKVNVGVNCLVQVSPLVREKLRPMIKDSMRIKDMLRFKYLVSVEGNDVATNLKWALASNSVVFMPIPTRESFILESKLVPWIHFVPLKYDLSDLEAKVDFCESAVSHCKKIAAASRNFMRMFSTRAKLFHLGAQVYTRHVQEISAWEREL